jgi:glutathione synthase/RimK-type ligase-like ATP-grasp enzyme
MIDLAEVSSAWLWRSWNRYGDEEQLRELAKHEDRWRFFQGEWYDFHKGVALTLAANGVFCVNPPPFNLAFEEKCCQLFLAAQVGLAIPPSLYTTRLALARDFSAAHGDDIIYKPFRTYSRLLPKAGDEPLRIANLYTNRIKADDLVEGDGFLPTPSIFQPYVAKALELRIVVVGRKLFACAIHSQRSERTREDWRRYDMENTPHKPYDLPDEIAARLLLLMERLGLVFGSIDMIVTPDGEYIFIEVNPNGQFDWIAQMAGLPIYEHLAAMLHAGRADYPERAAQGAAHGA